MSYDPDVNWMYQLTSTYWLFVASKIGVPFGNSTHSFLIRSISSDSNTHVTTVTDDPELIQTLRFGSSLISRESPFSFAFPLKQPNTKFGGATGNRTPICSLQSYRITVIQMAPKSTATGALYRSVCRLLNN
jgi:hypothetical protein